MVTHTTTATLRERYQKSAIPALTKAFGYSNVHALPRITKVVVNTGVGRLRDEKQMKAVERSLSLITGQKPSARAAKKAIAAFKTRKGLIVGYQITIRGKRMWDFLSRLINIAIPRQRDFQGIDAKSFDQGGNLTLGFKEHIVFPEMIGEDVPFIFGLEVTIVTTAASREEGALLLSSLGFPLKHA